jgi:LPS export ABC transporter protein LptC
MRRIGVLFLILLAAGCGTEDPGDEPVPRPEGIPNQIVENLVLKETKSGRLQWVLDARRALRYNGRPTELEGLSIRFYDAGGDSVESTLTAEGGTVDEETRELLARGDVVVLTSDGIRLESPELRWDPEIEKITTETEVMVADGDNVLHGQGITSDIHLKSYVIHRDVRGTLRDEDGRVSEELR